MKQLQPGLDHFQVSHVNLLKGKFGGSEPDYCELDPFLIAPFFIVPEIHKNLSVPRIS